MLGLEVGVGGGGWEIDALTEGVEVAEWEGEGEMEGVTREEPLALPLPAAPVALPLWVALPLPVKPTSKEGEESGEVPTVEVDCGLPERLGVAEGVGGGEGVTPALAVVVMEGEGEEEGEGELEGVLDGEAVAKKGVRVEDRDGFGVVEVVEVGD